MTLTRTLGVQCCAASRQTNMCILSCMWTRNHSCPMYTFPDQWQRWPPTMKLTPMVAPAAYTLRQVLCRSIYLAPGQTLLERRRDVQTRVMEKEPTQPQLSLAVTAVLQRWCSPCSEGKPLQARWDFDVIDTVVKAPRPWSTGVCPPVSSRHRLWWAAIKDARRPARIFNYGVNNAALILLGKPHLYPAPLLRVTSWGEVPARRQHAPLSLSC